MRKKWKLRKWATFIAFSLFSELGDVDEVLTFLGGSHGNSANFLYLLSLS